MKFKFKKLARNFVFIALVGTFFLFFANTVSAGCGECQYGDWRDYGCDGECDSFCDVGTGSYCDCSSECSSNNCAWDGQCVPSCWSCSYYGWTYYRGDGACDDFCGETTTASSDCYTADCAPSCTPSCTGKVCGDNGCGGSCGTCPNAGTSCRYSATCDAWNYRNTCSSGSCTGATEWTTDATDESTCDEYVCATGQVCSAGSCVTACSGCNIGGTCYSNGAYNPNNGCQKCDTSSSTTAWTNVASGTDPNSACTASGCSNTGNCDGSGSCQTPAEDADPNSYCTASGCSNTGNCNGAGACKTPSSGTDPNSYCGALDCDGGATRYYWGWDTDNICYYKSDVSAANAHCDGSSSCKSTATECSEEGKGTTTEITYHSSCRSGCSGTTAPSTANDGTICATGKVCSGGSCATSAPCTGNLNFVIEPSSISPSGQVNFIASGLTSCSGKTIQFWETNLKTGGGSPRPDVLAGSCTSEAAGCSIAYTSPSQEGNYYYFAKLVKSDGDIYSATKTLEVKTCSSTPPSKQDIGLGNTCKITLEPYALDVSDGSSGRWKGSSIDDANRKITTTFDDRVSGDCDGDLTFENSWSEGTNILSITSTRISKRGCFLWFCPNDLNYGYKAAASGNCKFLGISGACVSSNYCPIPQGLTTNSLTLLQPDTSSFTTYSYIIGECLSNDKVDGTSTACSNIYGNLKPKCDTASSMCATNPGTCAAPKNLGTLSSYGMPLPGATSSLSSSQPNDIFKATSDKAGYITVSMDGPGTSCDWDFWLNAESYCGSESTYIARSSAAVSCDEASSGYSFFAGDRYIKVHRNNGDGIGTISVRLDECLADNDVDARCPLTKPYCSNNVCVECLSDANCATNPNGKYCDTTNNKCVECLTNDDLNGDGVENDQCRSYASPKTCGTPLSIYPNRYARCDTTLKTCDACGPCNTNSDCGNNFCCNRDPTLAVADRGTGQCTDNVYMQKYLCAT